MTRLATVKVNGVGGIRLEQVDYTGLKGRLRWAIVLIGCSSLLVSCFSQRSQLSEGGAPDPVASGVKIYKEATPRGVLTQATPEMGLTEVVDIAIALAYVERRFGGLSDLSWTKGIIEKALEDVRSVPDDDADAVAMNSILRLIVAEASPPARQRLVIEDDRGEIDTNAMVTASLWCDRREIPSDFLGALQRAGDQGGYVATHALAAAQLLMENGCEEGPRTVEVRDRLAQLVSLIIPVSPTVDPSMNLGESGTAGKAVGDLGLEACALLEWVGHGELIPTGFETTVKQSQLADGGWPLEPGGTVSDAHATAWGLRCLMELEYGAGLEPTPWVMR